VTEAWFLTDRAAIQEIPGTRRARPRSSRPSAAERPNAIAHLELYSCFPIAPRLSAATLGLDRPVASAHAAGGLRGSAGPGHNYGTHALAALVAALRADRGALGARARPRLELHEARVAVLGGAPPPERLGRVDTREIRPGRTHRRIPRSSRRRAGPATIEPTTIVHGRDGAPERGVVIARLDGERRTMAALPPSRDASSIARCAPRASDAPGA